MGFNWKDRTMSEGQGSGQMQAQTYDEQAMLMDVLNARIEGALGKAIIGGISAAAQLELAQRKLAGAHAQLAQIEAEMETLRAAAAGSKEETAGDL